MKRKLIPEWTPKHKTAYCRNCDHLLTQHFKPSFEHSEDQIFEPVKIKCSICKAMCQCDSWDDLYDESEFSHVLRKARTTST